MAAANTLLTVTTPLGPGAVRLVGLTGREAVSQLFRFELDLVAPAGEPVDFEKLLGQPVTVGLTMADGATRHIAGICSRVGRGASDPIGAPIRRTRYRMEVVPKLWLLTHRRASRIFQQMSVPDILKQVLTGIDASFQLQGRYEPRDYCTQYRETDFAFVSRLMEEEGIFYFFKHADGRHTMVVADTPVAHAQVPGAATIRFESVIGGLRPEDRIHGWEKVQELTAGKLTLWDHCFELPAKNLEAMTPLKPESVIVGTVSHRLKLAANEPLELYDYPGGYAGRFDGIGPGGGDRASDVAKIFQDNLRTVNVRMGEEAAHAIAIAGASDCRQLVAGHKFTLERHDDGDGAYVLTAVSHAARIGSADLAGGDEAASYENTFSCIPATLPYRPPRTTPRPHVPGCQTAVVVGPPGEEIFTDKYGRVKVQFPWDREGKRDASSSCWVRVASFWAGRQWGAVHLPRVGQEVVVDYLEGDPDQPIIVGSVYNADNMPPYALPANKTQSGVKSRSTLKGGAENFNELRFEDRKGEEHVFLQAEKDLNVRVKHDETRVVWHDRTTTILANDIRHVGGKDKDGNEIGGDDTVLVTKGNREVTVKAGALATSVAKSATTKVGENDTTEIGKDQALTVKGSRTTQVAKDDALDVAGQRSATVGKDDRLEVGKKLVIEAGDEIVLKTGMAKIVMKKDGTIEISGKDVKVKAMAGVQLKGIKVAVEADAQAEIKGAMVKVEGQGMLQLKAPMSQLNGDGMLTIKGGITMIN